jgi:catechol 2,3-dioxygenase-like lactoylglutathione lyase family enzyme
MIITVEHLGLPASNPTQLKDWYVNVLGAKVVFESGQIPPAFFVQFPGGLMLEIYQSESVNPVTGHNTLAGFRHLALQVESIEQAKSGLEKKGVTFTEQIKPAAGGGKVLFFRDGEANLLHFVERPKDSIFRH